MPKTGSERTKDWRDQLKKQGYRQKALLLSPQALADLKKLRDEHDSDAAAVTAALRQSVSSKRAGKGK